MKNRILIIGLIALSTGLMLSTNHSEASASAKYHTSPSITRGNWTPKWVITPTLSSKNLKVSKKSVKLNGHSYKVLYVEKSSKNSFTFHLKKHKAVKLFYKIRKVGNRKNVKTLSVKTDLSTTGYNGFFYKGNLWKYPYKDTNFITFDSEYNNGLPFDYVRITGKTLPNANVYSSNGADTMARKDGSFTLNIRRPGKLMIGNSITVYSKRSSAKKVSKQLVIATDPDGDDYDQSDYDSNLNYASDIF